MSYPVVTLDLFGTNERAQIMVYGSSEDPAAHIRFNKDLSEVVEVVVRAGLPAVTDHARATGWEVERDKEGPGLELPKGVPEELEAGQFWMVEWVSSRADRYGVVKVGRNATQLFKCGSDYGCGFHMVTKWLMQIELPS